MAEGHDTTRSSTRQKLLGAALALREDIYGLGAELAAGHAAPREIIDRIAAVQASALAKATLQPIEGRYAWSWVAKTSPIEAALGPISQSAITMLMQADLTRIKRCPAKNAAGCSSTRQRTRAAVGARWRFAATAPNKSELRRRGLRKT